MEYLVVLMAALFHAIWNGMVKDSHDRLLALAAIRTVGLFFGGAVILCLPPLEPEAMPYLLFGTLILFLYYWFLLNTYRVGDFSHVYPISRGSAPLIVFLLGAVFAGEYLSFPQVAAVLLICSGILALSLTQGKVSRAPLIYAMGTACCIAGYTVVNGMGARIAHSAIVYAGWLEALCGLCMVLFTCVKRKQKVKAYVANHWQKGLLAGVLSVSGFLSVIWAMTLAPLAPISALRETSIIFAALIGAFKYQEGQAVRRVTSASVVVLGIAVLVYFSHKF